MRRNFSNRRNFSSDIRWVKKVSEKAQAEIKAAFEADIRRRKNP